MRRRLTVACAVISSAALIGIGAGCGGSSASEAETPAGATTVANNAPQTDSTGKTVPVSGADTTAAPDATTQAPDATTQAPAADAGGGAAGTASGDVAVGKTTFEANCQGCHNAGGTQAGVGPKLQGAGLTPTAIKTRIVGGGGTMPAGLVSGTDLTNVVAYVSSLQ